MIDCNEFSMLSIFKTATDIGVMLPNNGMDDNELIGFINDLLVNASSHDGEHESNILCAAVMSAGLNLILQDEDYSQQVYGIIGENIRKIKNKGENKPFGGTSHKRR